MSKEERTNLKNYKFKKKNYKSVAHTVRPTFRKYPKTG